MVDLVDLQQDGLHNIVADEFEIGLADEVRDVLLAAGEEAVEADDLGGRGEGGGAAQLRAHA